MARTDDFLMLHEQEHPEAAGLPDYTVLGPDPEPIGHQQHLALIATASMRTPRA